MLVKVNPQNRFSYQLSTRGKRYVKAAAELLNNLSTVEDLTPDPDNPEIGQAMPNPQDRGYYDQAMDDLPPPPTADELSHAFD